MREFLWKCENKVRSLVGKRPLPRKCCRTPGNLQLALTNRPDLGLRVCKVCGSRHFELTIDPGNIFSRGEPI